MFSDGWFHFLMLLRLYYYHFTGKSQITCLFSANLSSCFELFCLNPSLSTYNFTKLNQTDIVDLGQKKRALTLSHWSFGYVWLPVFSSIQPSHILNIEKAIYYLVIVFTVKFICLQLLIKSCRLLRSDWSCFAAWFNQNYTYLYVPLQWEMHITLRYWAQANNFENAYCL